ncbi:hypothetical protein ACR75P_08420 [Faecalicoccus pleomorphus]|uniref:hypothetical protein n=1 Tax=Faecalicoccus pleomorphus TaxID=1323 RepID=UPI003DA38C97
MRNEIYKVDLTDWKKRQEIMLDLLHQGIVINDREIRTWAEEQNEDWYKGTSEFYIAHSQNGYKQTTDRNEILDSAKDLKKKGINMLQKYWKVVRKLNKDHEREVYISLFDDIHETLMEVDHE